MNLPRPQDAIHKAHLYRLLSAILDHPRLNKSLAFKGGSCSAMLGILDRFSVDLDFDLIETENLPLKDDFSQIFAQTGFDIKDQSQNVLQFFVKYPAPPGQRNTIKIDALPNTVKSNQYSPQYLSDIGRYAICQTTNSIFANKLVAPLDRYHQNKSVAGRDLYDIHHFFLANLSYNSQVISERTKLQIPVFFRQLTSFINKYFNQTVIDQDLNLLLPPHQFQSIRKTLKNETLVLIKDELASPNLRLLNSGNSAITT